MPSKHPSATPSTSRQRKRIVVAATATAALTAGVFAAPSATAADDPATVGQFASPFVEPDIYGVETDEKCIPRRDVDPADTSGTVVCKPAAGSIALLPDGDVLYWSALESTENADINAVAQFGLVAENDQSRRLSFGQDGPEWRLPAPVDGGAEPQEPLPLVEIAPLLIDQGDGPGAAVLGNENPRNADGAMFGSDQVFLGDGRLLVASGTDYYSEFGAVELEGLRATRIYDPDTNTWENVGDLTNGRWYPTLVTLADGRVLAFSGVQKLIKPVYIGEDIGKSGRNEVTVESFDPETGEWTVLPGTADRSLPLYPRVHLLPNGDVFFNTNGQTFNPFGQAYDEALWNIASVFDPDTDTWTDLGVPGTGDLGAQVTDGAGVPDIGYRGSTFSVMLPLRPDDDGTYRTVDLLSAGGTVGTTPGSYLPVASSRLTRVTVDDDTAAMQSRSTAPLNQARWYGHGTVLPTGEVLVTSGGNRDHVLAPGFEDPITVPELYDPETETWTPVAEQIQPRTYHNSAVLLPDARVLVGGHNPIPTGYNNHRTLPGRAPNDGRDPSFEIYSPPYLFRGEQPRITKVADTLAAGDEVRIKLDIPASEVGDVMLVRNTAETHIVDGDQRSVVVPVVKRTGRSVTVTIPDTNVLPAGPYMLFVNRTTDEGPVPSTAAMVTVAAGRTGEEPVGQPLDGRDDAPAGDPSSDEPPVPVPTIGAAAGPDGVTASVTFNALSTTGAVPFTPAGDERSLPLLPGGLAAVLVAGVAVAGSRIRRS